MKIPKVSGRNLNRQKLTFPDDFTGAYNLVFIAFLRRHQDDIDRWVPHIEALAKAYPDLHYYEFPTLADRGMLYRMFLNEGMRAGIPADATRARTITLYLDKHDFREALEIPSENNIWLYLFDRSGQVLWREEGAYSEEKLKALEEKLIGRSD